MDSLNSCLETNCFVYRDGSISCVNPCAHSTFCEESDFTDWPFDYHLCRYEYMSRIKSINQLNFSRHSITVDFEEGKESNDWVILSAYSYSGSRSYMFDGFNATHPYIIFNFEFQRLSKGLIMQIIVPAVVLLIVNIFALLLNPESLDRFVLYVISLFSHMMFLEQLRWM